MMKRDGKGNDKERWTGRRWKEEEVKRDGEKRWKEGEVKRDGTT